MRMAALHLYIMLPVLILLAVVADPRSLLCAAQGLPVAHLILSRRGGALAGHEPANLTHLLQLLHSTERKYARARREVKGNKLVRKWRSKDTGTTRDEQLLSEPGQDGSW